MDISKYIVVADGEPFLTTEAKLAWMKEVRPRWRTVLNEVAMAGYAGGVLVSVSASLLNDEGRAIDKTAASSLFTPDGDEDPDLVVQKTYVLAVDALLEKIGFRLQPESVSPEEIPPSKRETPETKPELSSGSVGVGEAKTSNPWYQKTGYKLRMLHKAGIYRSMATPEDLAASLIGPDRSEWNFQVLDGILEKKSKEILGGKEE